MHHPEDWFLEPNQGGARLALLHAEIPQWLRTPFCLHAQAPGAGVDCVHLVHALARATCWPHALLPPAYTCQDTLHRDDSLLHAYLDEAPGIRRVDPPESSAVGDMVTFRIGRAAHHLGMIVALPGTFIHVMSHHHVAYSELADSTWADRRCRRYRLTGPIIEP